MPAFCGVWVQNGRCGVAKERSELTPQRGQRKTPRAFGARGRLHPLAEALAKIILSGKHGNKGIFLYCNTPPKQANEGLQMSIVSLQEISDNSWRARYHGNYGVYTIKIKTDGKKTVEFSCSCPSSYYPCKHIPMIENAIKQDISDNAKNDKKHNVTVEQLLEKATQKELRNAPLLRSALSKLRFGYEDIGYEKWLYLAG